MRFPGAMVKGEARLQLLFSFNAGDKPKELGLGEQRERSGAALGSLPVFLFFTFPDHFSMVQGRRSWQFGKLFHIQKNYD